MSTESNTKISPLRLRAGVVLILLWWIPFWLLAPFIADLFDSSDNSHLVATITTTIVIIQTVIGILGIIIAGKEVKSVVKDSPKKEAFKKIRHILIHGSVGAKNG